jgi:hypothetical protein
LKNLLDILGIGKGWKEPLFFFGSFIFFIAVGMARCGYATNCSRSRFAMISSQIASSSTVDRKLPSSGEIIQKKHDIFVSSESQDFTRSEKTFSTESSSQIRTQVMGSLSAAGKEKATWGKQTSQNTPRRFTPPVAFQNPTDLAGPSSSSSGIVPGQLGLKQVTGTSRSQNNIVKRSFKQANNIIFKNKVAGQSRAFKARVTIRSLAVIEARFKVDNTTQNLQASAHPEIIACYNKQFNMNVTTSETLSELIVLHFNKKWDVSEINSEQEIEFEKQKAEIIDIISNSDFLSARISIQQEKGEIADDGKDFTKFNRAAFSFYQVRSRNKEQQEKFRNNVMQAKTNGGLKQKMTVPFFSKRVQRHVDINKYRKKKIGI